MARHPIYYWFTFADGYCVCTRGYSALEMKHEVTAHGRLISKKQASAVYV